VYVNFKENRFSRVRVTAGVRVSTDCGSYFYVPNTRKVYFTMGLM